MGKNRYWKYYQPNKKDLKDEQGDCVIRSLCKATGLDWVEVFDELIVYAREEQCMPNNKKSYERFLDSHGFKWVGLSAKKGSKRPTPNTFHREKPDGVYVLRLSHHLVTVEDGKFYDTWDCGECCIYGYWERQSTGVKAPVLF